MKMSTILFGMMILIALSASVVAQENPTVYEVGTGTVTVPADTTYITVSAESSNQNATLAASEAQDMLNRAEDALISAGVKREEILSGQGGSTFSYQGSSRVCRQVNNSTVCDVSNSAANKVTKSFSVKIKTTDQSRIDSIVETAKSIGAIASVTGYGLSDASSVEADARKKAIDDAKSRAQQDVASFGYSLGKLIDAQVYPPEINPSHESGHVDVTSYVRATYEMV